ncbi:hypothetical protein [Gaoshiqia sp. Z1-71]|uniref:hypothetical protein n=1 Tax=Gaoshiqia hydrogeniformans TaxID=3290090 RepID=UPI003BF8CD4A
MECLISIISMILLIGLIFIPIVLFVKLRNSKFRFLVYLIIGLIITAGITSIFAWWTNYSDELLLGNYGYDLNAMNDLERYGNIKSEDLEKVKQIEISYFGIGWPLKAIITYVYYSPYLLIVYLIGIAIKKMKLNRNNKSAP